METFSTEIYEILENSKNVVIAAHTNPDGDAVGSALALALVASEIGEKPIVLLDKYSHKFDFLKGKEFIYTDDYDKLEPDVFIAVDCGDKKRLGDAEAVFDRANVTFNFDHHISNNKFAKYNIVCPDASSSCEIVYEIIKNFSILSTDIATAIYTGILTDTGGFKHKSTTAKTMSIISKIIEFGVDFTEIQNKVLFEHTEKETAVFAKALQNIKTDGKIIYTTLSCDEIKSCGADYSDLDGIVGYLINTKDMEVALFIYEKADGSLKASLRSRKTDVNKIASVFGGGGHILAAGANIIGKNIDSTVDDVIKEIKKEL